MTTLHITCAYCDAPQDVEHEGGYAPRYANCPACGRRFIYEPLEQGVRTLRPEDAATAAATRTAGPSRWAVPARIRRC